jgi:hypothetical protein
MLHSQACDALIVRAKIRNAQRRKPQVMNFFKECCPNATRREQAICCAFSHDRGGTTDAELRLASGLALMGKFDGEVGSGTQTYMGTARVLPRSVISTSNRFLISASDQSRHF